MRIHRFGRGLGTRLLILFLAAGAASVGVAAHPATAPAASSTYDIYAIVPATGGAAFLGKSEQDALGVFEKLINSTGGVGGHPIHFVIQDDQTNPPLDVQLAGTIIARHVPVILGPSLVASCLAIAPLVAKAGPVDYCLSPGIHPQKGSYVFSGSISTTALASSGIRYFRDRGWTRIGVITSTDATGKDADEAIAEALALPGNKGVFKIVDYEHFNTSDISVISQMTKIKAADPQAVIAWSTGAPIATVFKGLAAVGLTVPVYTTDGNQTYAEMKQFAAFLPKELYFSSPSWSAVEILPAGPVKDSITSYLSAFQAVGVRPDVAHSLAWDPAELVIAAFRRLGVGATAAQLRDYLAGLTAAPGINGVHDFVKYPQRGLSDEDAYVVRWDAAKDAWIVVSEAGGAALKK